MEIFCSSRYWVITDEYSLLSAKTLNVAILLTIVKVDTSNGVDSVTEEISVSLALIKSACLPVNVQVVSKDEPI